MLQKADGTAFTSSIFDVPKGPSSPGTSTLLINDAAFTTIPAGCYITKYSDLVETTMPNGLSMGNNLCLTPPGDTTSCRSITVFNTAARIISGNPPEFEFTFTVTALTKSGGTATTLTIAGT